MDSPKRPEGTVVTSALVAEMAVDEVMQNLQLLFPKELFETIPAESYTKIVEAFTGFGMKVGSMVASNRADLTSWVTAKTGTTIVGNPDECEINAPGITYELRYTMVQRGPEGETKSTYTYDEAVNTFGEGSVEEMWGSFGSKGTHQMDCGETTYWFSTGRVPVQKTFETTMTQEKTNDMGETLNHAETQQGKAQESMGITESQGSPKFG